MNFKIFLLAIIVCFQYQSIGQKRNSNRTTTTIVNRITTGQNGEQITSTTKTSKKNGEVIYLEKDGKVLLDKNNPNNVSDKEIQQGSAKGEKVFICFGPEAYAYHKRICDGVSHCSVKIETVPLSEAKALDRIACELCYK
jgi:hypothetical protein